MGAEQRQALHLSKMPDVLRAAGYSVRVQADRGSTHLFDQVYPYTRTPRLVMGHGAGMFFSLFLELPANRRRVVELIPPQKLMHFDGASMGLPRIARAFGFELARVCLENNRSSLERKDEVVKILQAKSLVGWRPSTIVPLFARRLKLTQTCTQLLPTQHTPAFPVYVAPSRFTSSPERASHRSRTNSVSEWCRTAQNPQHRQIMGCS